MKNPTIATLLNIIPGLGYIYIGGKRRIFGFILISSLITGTIPAFDPSLYEGLDPYAAATLWEIFGLISIVLGVVAFMYDGYTSANMHNASLSSKK